MKHTPGPWIAVGPWVEHPNDDMPDICVCDPSVFHHTGRNYEEQHANARLIAAAPELLAAVIKLNTILKGMGPLYKTPDDVLSAIAKAGGAE